MDTKSCRGNYQPSVDKLNFEPEGGRKHESADKILSVVKKKSLMGKKASRATLKGITLLKPLK